MCLFELRFSEETFPSLCSLPKAQVLVPNSFVSFFLLSFTLPHSVKMSCEVWVPLPGFRTCFEEVVHMQMYFWCVCLEEGGLILLFCHLESNPLNCIWTGGMALSCVQVPPHHHPHTHSYVNILMPSTSECVCLETGLLLRYWGMKDQSFSMTGVLIKWRLVWF